MSDRNTVVRSLHDVGAAAWFGGALMGAVGVNGAASDAADPAERTRLAADGWARWAPVSAAAIGAHLLGGAGLVLANRNRAAAQRGVTANSVAKAGVTLAAVAATAYSGRLGSRIAAAGRDAGRGRNRAVGADPGAGRRPAAPAAAAAVDHPGPDRHGRRPRRAAGRAAATYPAAARPRPLGRCRRASRLTRRHSSRCFAGYGRWPPVGLRVVDAP